MIRLLCIGLVVLALAACQPPAASYDRMGAAPAQDQDAVDYCRTAFPDAARNPGAPGGRVLEPSLGRLCLFGSLEDSDVSAFISKLRQDEVAIQTLAVRSSGGSVGRWLEIAEATGQRKPALVVDEAGYSSCANYAVPVSSSVSLQGEALDPMIVR